MLHDEQAFLAIDEVLRVVYFGGRDEAVGLEEMVDPCFTTNRHTRAAGCGFRRSAGGTRPRAWSLD